MLGTGFFGYLCHTRLVPSMSSVLPMNLLLTVSRVVPETASASTIWFAKPDKVFSYQAGQFLLLDIPYRGETHRRAFSFASDPYTDAELAITVKRLPGGRFSHFLLDYVGEGDQLSAEAPLGRFVPDLSCRAACHRLLVAGGSGVVPLFSILKATLHVQRGCQVTLFYASRHEEDIIYKTALEQLAARYHTRFRLVHFLSAPKERPYRGMGRLTAELLHTLLREEPLPQEAFLCGPEGLMGMAEATLLQMGMVPERICREFFTPPTPPAEVSASSQVTFIHKGVSVTGGMRRTESLLQAARRQGISIPAGCMAGMCNVCKVRCRKGKADMLHSEGLTPEELAAGDVLSCVAYPASEALEIEVGEERLPPATRES